MPSGAILSLYENTGRCATQSVCGLFRSGVGKLMSEFGFTKNAAQARKAGGYGARARGVCVDIKDKYSQGMYSRSR